VRFSFFIPFFTWCYHARAASTARRASPAKTGQAEYAFSEVGLGRAAADSIRTRCAVLCATGAAEKRPCDRMVTAPSGARA
jgi:hypothetical protein